MTSVILGNISGESVKGLYVRSLAKTLQSALVEGSILGWGDHDLGKSRNLVVEQFLDETQADQLWFVDSDMTWSVPDLRDFLARHQAARGIVGGVYRRPQWELRDERWEKVDEEWDAREPSGESFAPGTTGCHPASYVGAAALLCPRRTLEEVGRDWFTLRGRGVAEDLSFCLRVHDAGLPVQADFDFRLGHVKSEVLY